MFKFLEFSSFLFDGESGDLRDIEISEDLQISGVLEILEKNDKFILP